MIDNDVSDISITTLSQLHLFSDANFIAQQLKKSSQKKELAKIGGIQELLLWVDIAALHIEKEYSFLQSIAEAIAIEKLMKKQREL